MAFVNSEHYSENYTEWPVRMNILPLQCVTIFWNKLHRYSFIHLLGTIT